MILTESPSKLQKGCHRKKKLSLKIPIHDFHKQNTVFHLISICCRHGLPCYNYGCRSTTKIKVFASVRNSHRTWLWTRHRKTNANLRFLMNKIIRSILTLQVANRGINIISASFKFLSNLKFEEKFLNFWIFWKGVRVPHDFSHD